MLGRHYSRGAVAGERRADGNRRPLYHNNFKPRGRAVVVFIAFKECVRAVRAEAKVVGADLYFGNLARERRVRAKSERGGSNF